LEENRHYKRNPDFIYREIVDEAVLVPIHQDVADMDCVYTLNEMGAFIWGLIEQPMTQEALKTAILDQYEVDPEIMFADLQQFLDEMISINALRMV